MDHCCLIPGSCLGTGKVKGGAHAGSDKLFHRAPGPGNRGKAEEEVKPKKIDKLNPFVIWYRLGK